MSSGWIPAILLAIASGAQGQAPITDAVVRADLTGPQRGRVSVIVREKAGTQAQDERAFARLGGYVYRHLPIIGSEAVNLPVKNLRKLTALPGVGHVSADLAVVKNDLYTVGSSGASSAWSQYGDYGGGVGVAIVDSGIASSADFGNPSAASNRLVASVNFSPDASSATDLCGHGTHVAGIVAGNGNNSSWIGCFSTYYGIAPKASLINVRVLDASGTGSVSQVIAGIQWAVSHQSAYNIRVLNLSIGHPVGESYTLDPLCQACEAAWKSGIVVVCAAGNEGRLYATQQSGEDNGGYGTNYGSIDSPGNDPTVITVGAMKRTDSNRSDDTIATYSSRGPTRLDFISKPDITAAGNRIDSVIAPGSTLDVQYGATNEVPWSAYSSIAPSNRAAEYFQLSGTSMATPVVSGAAALMLSLNPLLSPDTVKARLMMSADKWTDGTGNGSVVTYGAGYLDIPAALKSSYVALGPATSPSLVWNPNGMIYIVTDRDFLGTLFSGLLGALLELNLDTSIYGQHALWGEGSLWSSNAGPIYPDHALWGENSLWSDNSTSTQSFASAGVGSTNLNGD